MGNGEVFDWFAARALGARRSAVGSKSTVRSFENKSLVETMDFKSAGLQFGTARMRIAVSTSDIRQLSTIVESLSILGHATSIFETHKALKLMLKRESFDLLIVDISKYEVDATDMLRRIRSLPTGSQVPLLLMSCGFDDAATTHLLDAGADDCIEKKISPDHFRARVVAVLRRIYSKSPYQVLVSHSKANCAGGKGVGIEVDHSVRLTPKELKLAALLIRHINHPVSRGHIADLIWSRYSKTFTRTVDSHVSMLRSKLQLYPNNGFNISSIYGYGYRLDAIS